MTLMSSKLQSENQELRGLVETKDAEIARLAGALASFSRGANEIGIAAARPESAELIGALVEPCMLALRIQSLHGQFGLLPLQGKCKLEI